MILVRLLIFVVLAGIGGSLLAWLITGKRHYLRYAQQTLRFAIILAALFVAFFVLERVVLR